EPGGGGSRPTSPDVFLLLSPFSARANPPPPHGRSPGPDDLLAEGNLRRVLGTTGWHLEEYEDAAGHFLARAVPRG
ncbi:methyltransferase type 11, partial [Streptomyces nojiriensis]